MATHRELLPQVIGVQIASIALSFVLVLFGIQVQMSADDVEAYGGNLTLLLLVLVIIAHSQARRGKGHPILVALVSVIPPAYAFMDGPLRHLVVYHISVLFAHLVILFGLARHAAREAAASGATKTKTKQKAEDDEPESGDLDMHLDGDDQTSRQTRDDSRDASRNDVRVDGISGASTKSRNLGAHDTGDASDSSSSGGGMDDGGGGGGFD